MKTKTLLFVALFATTGAYADDTGQSYFNGQGGYLITDSDRQRDNNWLFGVGAGSNLSEHFAWEINLNHTRLHDKSNTLPALDLTGLSLDGLFYLNRARVAPYLLIGAGVITDRLVDNGANHSFLGEAGLGLRALLWESSDQSRSFSLRPEIKARYDDIGGGHYIDYIGTLAFQFGFGAKPTPVAVVSPPPPPQPAPPPPPLPPAAPPPPADSDGDGVTDNSDRCPDTAPGVMVDQYGCEQKGSVTLEGVTFDFDSAVLTTDSRPILGATAQGLKTHPRVHIEIQGHTDSKGAAAYNVRLSQQRAEAVQSYLIQQGAAPGQVVAKGYGETQPVADNRTDEGRAKNRRVVMNVLENPRNIPVTGAGEATKTTE